MAQPHYVKPNGYVALISVIIIGAIAVTVGTTLLILGLNFSRTSLVVIQSQKAKNIANACAEQALQQIRDSGSSSGNLTLGSDTCTYNYSGSGAVRTVTATGTSGTVVRKITATTSQVTPKIIINSWQELP